MRQRYKLLLFLLCTFCMPSIMANAKAVQAKLCCGDNGLYSIQYDTSTNKNVNIESINCSNVNAGHLDYPNGVEDNSYKFTSVKIASKCTVDGSGQAFSCPKDSNLFSKIQEFYIKSDGSYTDNIKATIDGNGGFNLSIKKYGNYKVRIVPSENMNSDGNSAAGYSDFIGASGNYYKLYNLAGNKSMVIEFYQDGGNDGCADAFIGGMSIYTPDPNLYEIDNPALTDSSYGCDAVKSWKPDNYSTANFDKTLFNNNRKQIVSKCYDKTIMYGELGKLRADIQEGFDSFKRLYSIDKTKYKFVKETDRKKNPGAYTCSGVHNGETKVYAWSGAYWSYKCVENYEATGDNAKLVKAGDGFSYESTFKVTRQCEKIIVNPTKHYKAIESAVYCPVNIYCANCGCKCSWRNRYGQTGGGTSGGPTEEFDKCVKQCDGGAYSQSCINSCFQKTYGRSRNLSFMDNILNLQENKKNGNIKNVSYTLEQNARGIDFTLTGPDGQPFTVPGQLAVAAGLVQTAKGITSFGLSGYTYSVNIQNPNGVAAATCGCTLSDWCSDGWGRCHFYVWYSVCGIDTAYCGKVEQRVEEESTYVDTVIQQENIAIDPSKFSMTITDSYLPDGSGGHTTTYTTNSTPALQVDVVKDTPEEAIVKVRLPLSYINRQTGAATYKSNESSSTGYWMNAAKAQLEAVGFGNSSSDLAKYYYTPGERKYYTDIHSKNVNVNTSNNQVSLVSPGSAYKNIKVENNGGMGWSDFGSSIDCYYGVYNQFVNICPSGEPMVCDENDVCDCGIQYIFRPIVIGRTTKPGDVFPNGRNPRFNWSALSIGRGNDLYGVNVDPVKYTDWLEKVGREDYLYNRSNGEVDYEFILEPKNIAAIKSYNRTVSDFNGDGDKNYLDYDLSCFTRNGRQICTSRFLDNTDILTYGSGYNVEGRRSIAGCNNAKSFGTACDPGPHQ